MDKIIYADNASTTMMYPETADIMSKVMRACFGNPSSIHSAGRKSAELLHGSRADIAQCIGCRADEIYFTSGGTESDNMAILSAASFGLKQGKKSIISTKIEHHAVLNTLRALESDGFEVTYLDVYENGIVRVSDLIRALRPDTALVSVMYANNEIGTLQPVEEIGKLCRERGIVFHSDAVQAAGHLPIDVRRDNIDMLSVSAHKFHGPKGVGALYCRNGIPLEPIMHGGSQENGKRPSTENVAGIAAMSSALSLSCQRLDKNKADVGALRDELLAFILNEIPDVRLNGDRKSRLYGNINISFGGVDGEALVILLDRYGICASSASACMSGSPEPSHVLLALGLSPELARGALRITLGSENTHSDIEAIKKYLPEIIGQIRKIL